MAKFTGKVIIVTGAARGQGAAAARLIVENGGTVVLSDILDEQGKTLAQDLGNRARFVLHDVGNIAHWRTAVEVAGALGGLHGLVNNAGVLLSKSLMETSHDEWARVVRVNQTGCFLGLQVAAPAIARSGGGSIVNVASIAGLRGSPRNFAYAATKWALRGMTRAAAVDLAPQGIRVNAIYPGSIDTEMLSFWTAERREEWLRRVPMGRMASAEEAARVALFLLSEESSFVTGAEIAVDGGSAAS